MHWFCALVLLVAAGDIFWHSDYKKATALAKEQRKMLFISFDAELPPAFDDRVDEGRLEQYVFLRLARDAQINSDGKRVALLDHAAFAPLRKQAGFAIVDYRHRGPNFRRVVSVLPVQYVTAATHVAELLKLPMGSLSQRTLIWAMRVHPEDPRSADGPRGEELMRHAARHSRSQANRNQQYHNLPPSANSEIVAESWPWNRCIVGAALDIVNSWRQSPGHWSAASRSHRRFGYDMRSNGHKWFATGVFAD